MSGRIERTLRVFDVATGEWPDKPVRYWRTRPLEERLRETLKLHRDGNDLFKGGNPDFEHVVELKHVPTPRRLA